MNGDPILKAFLLTEVNHRIRDLAVDASWDDPEWEFFCECGRKDCTEQVKLTLAAYVALIDGEKPVLANGHRLSQVERARQLREGTRALMAQAEHQLKRLQKNTRATQGASRHPVKG